jgi:hypothetical protein
MHLHAARLLGSPRVLTGTRGRCDPPRAQAYVAGGAAAELLLVLIRTGVEARRGLSLFTIPTARPRLPRHPALPAFL